MTLYEIDERLTSLVDPETGEIFDFDAFQDLQMERETKLENICLWYKDLVAEANAIKQERDKLYKRQKAAENKAERLKYYLKLMLNGSKYKTGRVTVSYRHSEAVQVGDGFLEWAKANADELLSYKEPTANLTAIKEAIKGGREIPEAQIVEKENISIK